jgi:hypothetical protein
MCVYLYWEKQETEGEPEMYSQRSFSIVIDDWAVVGYKLNKEMKHVK